MYVKNLRPRFAQTVQMCCAMLGVNGERMPKSEEFELMLNFALDFWFNYRLEEIELAVKLNLAGKFDTDVPFHGYFDIKFVSAVLKEYDRFKAKAMQELKRKRESERPKTLHEPDYIVNSKLYDGLVQFIQSQGKFPDYWDFGRVYEHMKENNLLIEWSLERKKEEFERVKEALIKWKTESKIMAGSISQRNEAEGIDDHKKIIAECQRLHILATLIQ